MFKECLSLGEINLSRFNTSNIIDMSRMFLNCSSLKKLNFNNFNTKKVLYMNCKFFVCFQKLSLIRQNNLIKKEYENSI